jgi:HEAT repeat protein
VIPILARHRSLVLFLGAAVLLAPRAPAQDAEPRTSALARWSGATTHAHLEIGRALRESRRADSAPAPKLVERIANAGSGALDAQLDILAQARVPEAASDDLPQILSEPQRELLLAALARMPAKAVRAAIQGRLANPHVDVGARLAAMHALGTIGLGSDLAWLVGIAPRGPSGEKVLSPEAREALRSASHSILQRDPRAFPALAEVLRRTDAAAASALLDAAGSSPDPRALEVLFAAAPMQRELAPQIAALAAKCGPSNSPALNREFVEWLVSELGSARSQYARSLLQTIGILDDGACVPALIARLSDKEPGVKDSALWALRRVSGLAFPADPTAWTLWERSESTWHTDVRPRLRTNLVSSDPKLVVGALRAYGEHRTRRGELAAEVSRALVDAHPELRRLACATLQTIGSSSAATALTVALDDPDPTVADAAWRALKTITGIELPRDSQRVRELLVNS